MGFMTELGERTYALAKAYGLGNFYNIMGGNLIIDEKELTVEVMANITKFLKYNTDWVMGYEYNGETYCVYVTEIKTLA